MNKNLNYTPQQIQEVLNILDSININGVQNMMLIVKAVSILNNPIKPMEFAKEGE